MDQQIGADCQRVNKKKNTPQHLLMAAGGGIKIFAIKAIQKVIPRRRKIRCTLPTASESFANR